MKRLVKKCQGPLSKRKALLWTVFALLVLHLALRLSPYPDFKSFRKRERSVRFYDKNGILLQASSLENGLRREWTDWKKIPKKVKKAFLKA